MHWPLTKELSVALSDAFARSRSIAKPVAIAILMHSHHIYCQTVFAAGDRISATYCKFH
jgi:hypothetical protein